MMTDIHSLERTRIATARRFDDRVERLKQRGLMMNQRFATTTRPANVI